MSRLLTYLVDVAARGVRIVEHPAYGGVNPGLHMVGSMHSKGRAADLNYGPAGSPPEERPVLLWAARLADAAGLNVIYTPHRVHPIAKTAANHRDHLHVDDGPIAAYKPPGRDDALYARILAERPLPGVPTPPAPTISTSWEDMIMEPYIIIRETREGTWARVLPGIGVRPIPPGKVTAEDKKLRAVYLDAGTFDAAVARAGF